MAIISNTKHTNKPTALVILDGFGFSKVTNYNAVYKAYTPTLDKLQKKYFHTLLHASGQHVGLPKNYIGNSEVGHLTIGTGQITPQSLLALQNITLPENVVQNNSFFKIIQNKNINSRVHVFGMISDKGIHSHINHMKNMIKAVQTIAPQTHIILHLILDGRDSPPQSALKYIQEIQTLISSNKTTKIGSVHGRFYAMDRDNNKKRTEKSGVIFTTKQKCFSGSVEEYIQEQYAQNITDEFIKPTAFIKNHTINPEDIFIYTNYRLDRIVQIARYIQNNAQPAITVTPIPYKEIHSTSLYSPHVVKNGLISTLDKANKTIFSIAETEKHAHISYFFNGGTDRQFKNETRVFIPSKKEVSFAQNPEMSAREITNKVIESLQNSPRVFYLINYANADMVGHSGDFEATVKAIEFLDEQVQKLYEEIVVKQNGTLFITADHGNAESMFDAKSNQKNKAHTTNQVPFFAINVQNMQRKMQGLKDIAPCILNHLQIK